MRTSLVPIRSRAAAAVVVTLLAAGATGGCGGDDGSEDAGGDPGATTTEAEAPGETTTTEASEEELSDGEEPEVDDGDFCRVITKDEAEAIVGRSFGDPTSTTSESALGTTASCTYAIAEDGVAGTLVNVILVGTEVSRAQFDGELAAEAPEGTPVDGVGEAAVLLQPGILAVFDGGTALTVQALIDLQPVATDVLVDLAEQVLERL